MNVPRRCRCELLLLAASLHILGACGSDTTSPSRAPRVAEVRIALPLVSVVVGASTQATVSLRDAQGNELTGRAVSWSSANSAIASVSQTGLITGVAAGGPVGITATSEGVSGSVSIAVTPLPVVVGFSYPTGRLVAPADVSFQNQSVNASSYSWDFGDGSTSSEKDPVHRYATIGVYFVTLTARSGADSATVTRRVAVDADGVFQSSIVVAIDPTIITGISVKLNQFLADLVREGHRVAVHDVVESDPTSLRAVIQEYFRQLSPRLEGVVFIGQVPVPTAEFLYPNPPTLYSGPTLQYYMDLDGQFSFNNSGWISGHSGAVEIEVWTSILPRYGTTAETIARVNNYFVKNHRYRSGQMAVQRGFIKPVTGSNFTTEALYNLQLNIIRTQYYAALVNRGQFFVGIDNGLGDPVRFPTSRVSYTQEMLTDRYDVASVGAHGSAVAFGGNEAWGGILIDVAFAQATPLKPVFLLEHSCNTANFMASPNLATEFVYNSANNVLVFAGATAPQGGMGTTAMGTPDGYEASLFVGGATIGNAHFGPMKLAYTGVFAASREAFAAQQVIIGDGSLRLQEFLPARPK